MIATCVSSHGSLVDGQVPGLLALDPEIGLMLLEQFHSFEVASSCGTVTDAARNKWGFILLTHLTCYHIRTSSPTMTLPSSFDVTVIRVSLLLEQEFGTIHLTLVNGIEQRGTPVLVRGLNLCLSFQ